MDKPKEYTCAVEVTVYTLDKRERDKLKAHLRKAMEEYVAARTKAKVKVVSILSKTEELWMVSYND